MDGGATVGQVQLWALYVTAGNAVLSAVVALGGAWLAHHLTTERDKAKDSIAAENRRREIRRERIELLIEALEIHYENEWRIIRRLLARGIAWAHGQLAEVEQVIDADSVPALARADMLQSLYLPEWDDHMASVRQATLAVAEFLNDEGAALGANVQDWNANLRHTYAARSSDRMRILRTNINAIVRAARERIDALQPM